MPGAARPKSSAGAPKRRRADVEAAPQFTAVGAAETTAVPTVADSYRECVDNNGLAFDDTTLQFLVLSQPYVFTTKQRKERAFAAISDGSKLNVADDDALLADIAANNRTDVASATKLASALAFATRYRAESCSGWVRSDGLCEFTFTKNTTVTKLPLDESDSQLLTYTVNNVDDVTLAVPAADGDDRKTYSLVGELVRFNPQKSPQVLTLKHAGRDGNSLDLQYKVYGLRRELTKLKTLGQRVFVGNFEKLARGNGHSYECGLRGVVVVDSGPENVYGRLTLVDAPRDADQDDRTEEEEEATGEADHMDEANADGNGLDVDPDQALLDLIEATVACGRDATALRADVEQRRAERQEATDRAQRLETLRALHQATIAAGRDGADLAAEITQLEQA